MIFHQFTKFTSSPIFLLIRYIAIAGRLRAYRTSTKLTPFGDDGYYVIT